MNEAESTLLSEYACSLSGKAEGTLEAYLRILRQYEVDTP